MKPVSFLIIGAGSRGRAYAAYAAQFPHRMRVAAVADIDRTSREALARQFDIPASRCFGSWQEALDAPRLADAVIISTPDRVHVGPALRALEAGYHCLLEKPIAPSLGETQTVVRAAQASRSLFAVCHVLLYTLGTRRIREILAAGTIGRLMSLQVLEPIGYWHYAHSYVRGNWRRAEDSSPVLLAKSVHDVDWIRVIAGGRISRVSSFGSRSYFTEENAPAGASDRCLDCPLSSECPYSAVSIYLEPFREGVRGWPIDVLTPNLTEEGLQDALECGPYGRCVWRCDNDVMEQQQVNFLFDDGRTASFSMMPFTQVGHRRTRLFGSHGELETDGERVRTLVFGERAWREESIAAGDATVTGGHGGGDIGLMDAFTAAVATGNHDLLMSGPEESLESHRVAFAAEESRLSGRVVRL